ncbi:MAG: hypothetical protein QME94_05365 [Anaerolineae bacterium]|nr:hypothetical protein [Anaerolineae bacterium]
MSAPAKVLLPALPQPEPVAEAVLFGFDDRAFPFREGVQIHLIAGDNPKLVLEPGPKGSHDEFVHFYGTVIRIGDLLHMWYGGGHGPRRPVANIEPAYYNLCYAVSADGIHWEKPALGLVEFNESKQNNIVEFPASHIARTVLHDPESPDPRRRFKMVYESGIEGKPYFGTAFSADGLRWWLPEHAAMGPPFEMAGIVKFRGLYYVNGQPAGFGFQRPTRSRVLLTYASADFEHWSPCPALGLERSPDLAGPSTEADAHCYEEVHLGAALWNRWNVILGIYGQWHGHPSGDRRLVVMDLGLALSHDAIHFHEPIPGFRFIPAREQPGSPMGVGPALMQGQGMENIGDRTLYWYSLWRGTDGSGVRMVSWERDRLGMLKPYRPGRREGAPSQVKMQAVSCPIQVLPGGAARVHLNASGLGRHSQLRISVLDHGFRPIPGYSGDEGVVIAEDGLRLPVCWPRGDVLLPSQGVVRLQVSFEGVRAEDGCLHAVYVTGKG